LEQQTGVDVKTDFIQGPLFEALKQRVSTILQQNNVPHLDSVEDPPLAVQGQSPASGIFSLMVGSTTSAMPFVRTNRFLLRLGQ
jgi:hypothetical protein